jgi:uncharacterized repeat protein (TIGR03803 family)
VTTNGTLTTLFSFNGSIGENPSAGIGENPVAALTLGNDGNFYGTTEDGGNSGCGTVFKVTTNGTLTTLFSFTRNNGVYPRAFPEAALTLGNDGNFYGTTPSGGSSGLGNVFTTYGGFTALVSFANTNGENPSALTLGNDGNFYGTTYGGGSNNIGTVFKVTTNGTLTTLVSFKGSYLAYPQAGLTLGTDGNFYGTTYGGGSSIYYGTVFKVTTNGTLTTLSSFSGTNGANPEAALTLGTDGNFYGTTYGGGSNNIGTVFKVTTNGALTTLISFNGSNGGYPRAALTLGNDGNFYGTTSGGSSSGGTVFRLMLPPVVPPTLALQFVAGCPQFNLAGMLNNNFVVQYSTNLAGTNWINLLSVTNLSASPYQFQDPAGAGQPARFYRAFMQ